MDRQYNRIFKHVAYPAGRTTLPLSNTQSIEQSKHRHMRKSFLAPFILLATVLSLSACGQKGALYIADESQAAEPELLQTLDPAQQSQSKDKAPASPD